MSGRARPSPRLLGVCGPVYAAGAATIAAASASFAAGHHTPGQIGGILALLGASIVAERFPVPVEGADAGGVSLAFVFGLGAIVLYGWAPGALVVAAAAAITQVLEHRPWIRVAYNASAFAISAAAAGLASGLVGVRDVKTIAASVGIAGFVYYAVNLALISTVLARSSDRTVARSIASNLRWTIAPFAFMGSAAVSLVSLWTLSPPLSLSLAGPLLGIALYQRSTHRALQAMRLASTDPLTGVGNHRHFHECLARALADAQAGRAPLSLCLLDVDDFKRINDRFGHPAGDRLLAELAGTLRRDGEAFRPGGDEFALLLPGLDHEQALDVATTVSARIGDCPLGELGSVTVSAGVATFPSHAADQDELIRLADNALYWAKKNGKNCARAYRPDLVQLAELGRLAKADGRVDRFSAAAALARAVDARDAYIGGHSERVAELAARMAVRLGLSGDEVELIRLAGSLHDLGKLALPEELLRKRDALTAEERGLLERHPEIGFRMLESLGVEPVDAWVLHHHERWDGTGYPDRLAGSKIPLGARIVFVADAYDAMTSRRLYRQQLAEEDAIEELERGAGTQFDPQVVAALVEELGYVPERRRALAV